MNEDGRLRRPRRIGLAAGALALVVGGTLGGVALGNNVGSGEHGPGFSTLTSQAFAGGQEEPSEHEPHRDLQPGTEPAARH